MCWNAKVSLGTLCFSYAVAAWMWRRNRSYRDRWMAPFIAAFATIQLVEALFWWDFNRCASLKGCCTTFNKVVSATLLPWVLAAEPIAMLAGIHQARYGYLTSLVKPWLVWLVYGGFSGLIVVLAPVLKLIGNWGCTKVTEHHHLLWWGGERGTLPLLVLFGVLLSLPTALKMRPYSAMAVVLAVNWAAWFYAIFAESFGSNWCLWGNLISIICAIDPWLFDTDVKPPGYVPELDTDQKVAEPTTAVTIV
eukprot:TRINITY_DN7582_c0_g1_i2.p1 TRINITY_DN7582_c0_g1~~TRINITY_DN7582_c0_g1_i2.p1  ORF type:complete len:250 (-),score=50.75 TRINITY_DN7582_c0_g1_i2:51-800(-)